MRKGVSGIVWVAALSLAALLVVEIGGVVSLDVQRNTQRTPIAGTPPMQTSPTPTATPGWWGRMPLLTPGPTTARNAAPQGRQGEKAGKPSHCPSPNVCIEAPRAGVGLSGTVDFIGTAGAPEFGYYKVESGRDGENWTFLYKSSRQVSHGALFTLETSTVPPGPYWVRLTVVRKNGNYPAPCVAGPYQIIEDEWRW